MGMVLKDSILKKSPRLENLVEDIENAVLHPDATPELQPEKIAEFGVAVANKLVRALNRERRGPRTGKTIFASEIGKPCIRQTWYNYHFPEIGETLLPKNVLKFLYGDILEELLLFLAKAAGHKVESEQERVEISLESGWTISGRLDAMIDGVVVDVKSTSPYGFDDMSKNPKFDDKFGYRGQLSVYGMAKTAAGKAPHADPKMALFLVDKQNGSLAIVDVKYEPILVKAAKLTEALEDSVNPPPRYYEDEPFTNGNRKLGTACSYCAYKSQCWAGLRAFAYAKGPVFMTKVVKQPDVPEISLSTNKGK